MAEKMLETSGNGLFEKKVARFVVERGGTA
jgi:hypothetical protein